MFLFGNHLQQDAARNVGVIFLVDDNEVYSLDDQASYIRQRYIPALDRVVEPAVWVLFNHSRIAHGSLARVWPTRYRRIPARARYQ
jgi:hypothetical protein